MAALEFVEAHDELTAAHDDEAVHDALSAIKSPHAAWQKRWYDEVLPTLQYLKHRDFLNSSHMRVAKDGLSGVDIELKRDDELQQIEVTVAELALHPDWRNRKSHDQPGAQAAAIRRKMQLEGFVEPYNPIDGKTLKPIHEAHGETPESRLEACVNGLQFALDGKARGNGYGNNATLLVYGREFPRFLRCCRNWRPDDLLSRITVSPDLRAFNAVYLVAESEGWLAEIVGPSSFRTRVARSGIQGS